MKGFGIIHPGKSVGWLEKDKPKAGLLDAVLEPIAITPCSSDVHSAFEVGDLPWLHNRILGHEVVGRIIEVGGSVKDFKVGDVVVVPAATPDWLCPDIEDGPVGHTNKMGGAVRLSNTIDGGLAEFVMVPQADMNLALLPDNVSLESACMCTDMVPTGFRGADMANIQYGDDVCVVGIGPVGLMALLGAKLRGASNIFAVGSRPNCVALAREYGANEVLNYKDGPIEEQVLKLTKNKGVDRVIIAGGGPKVVEQAFKMTKWGATIANIDMYTDPKGINIPLLAAGFGIGDKKFVGGLCFGGRRYTERFLKMVACGRIDPSKMITHRFEGLDSAEKAFNLMHNKPADLIKPFIRM